MLSALKAAAAALPSPIVRRLRQVSARLRPGERELALMTALPDPDRAFLDVGANKGVYVEAALGRCTRVLAAEPFPQLAAYLRGAFGRRIEVLELALSDRAGSATLHVPTAEAGAVASLGSLNDDANPGFAQATVEVRVERLDALDLPPLGLIKIDVEGHEDQTVAGATGRLAVDRPALLIEIEEPRLREGSGPMLRSLAEQGYDAYFLTAGGLVALAGRTVASLQAGPPAKQYNRRRDLGSTYVNNFLFLHRSDEATRRRLAAAGYPVPDRAA